MKWERRAGWMTGRFFSAGLGEKVFWWNNSKVTWKWNGSVIKKFTHNFFPRTVEKKFTFNMKWCQQEPLPVSLPLPERVLIGLARIWISLRLVFGLCKNSSFTFCGRGVNQEDVKYKPSFVIRPSNGLNSAAQTGSRKNHFKTKTFPRNVDLKYWHRNEASGQVAQWVCEYDATDCK